MRTRPLPNPKRQAAARYVCSICGYVYDPADVAIQKTASLGAPDSEDIPDAWDSPGLRRGEKMFEVDK